MAVADHPTGAGTGGAGGYPLVVIGVDPGVTTGVAVFGFTEDTVEYIEHFQWPDPDIAYQQLDDLAKSYQAKGFRTILVVEQFDKRPGVINPDFTPKFICRDIDNHLQHHEVVYQIPAVAKNLVKQPRRGGTDGLRRFGWYTASNRHANDAVRHVIVYAVRELKHLPTILRGWPRPKGNK